MAFTKEHVTLDSKNTNMGIAAAITSHGRIILYRLFLEVQKMGGTILYCDTDRVFAALPDSPFGKPFGPFT